MFEITSHAESKTSREKIRNQIKAEVTINVLRFAGDIIMWSEENIQKVLSLLSNQLKTDDDEVIEALHQLDHEGVIHFIGASDIFLVPHPSLLEPYEHERHAELLHWVLETRLAREA